MPPPYSEHQHRATALPHIKGIAASMLAAIFSDDMASYSITEQVPVAINLATASPTTMDDDAGE